MAFQRRRANGRPYQVYIPAGPGPFPCIVYLHGVGENGVDGEKHLNVGLPPYVQRRAADFPAVVIAPQCAGPWKYVGPDEEAILEAVDITAQETSLDLSRLYLTGLSQGGCSTFDLGAKYPEKWAALVVVCGAGKPRDALRLRKTPIRIYHGERDEVVPPAGGHSFDGESIGGRDMSALLPHGTYIEYPGADHFIWDRVYADPAMWEWLFAQKRP